jgi:transcriptional regulator with XRE-family HTH domain
MTLGEKVRVLRAVEGELRGLERPMSQLEVVRALEAELGSSLSQSYLSQVESGARPHLTERTRRLLARFFRVHPGHLVSDPPGYHSELLSDLRVDEAPVDDWLRGGALKFGSDRALHDALLRVAAHDDSRKCLLLLGTIAAAPGLVDRLLDTLAPERRAHATPAGGDPQPADDADSSWVQ